MQKCETVHRRTYCALCVKCFAISGFYSSQKHDRVTLDCRVRRINVDQMLAHGTTSAVSVTPDFTVYRGVHNCSVPSLPASGSWAHPAERSPSLESIYRVSLTVDFCEGKGIKLAAFIAPLSATIPAQHKNSPLFHHSQLGAPQKEQTKSGGPGHVPSVPIG